MFFEKSVDTCSRVAMIEFLAGHYRYGGGYAHRVKFHQLGLTREQENVAFDLLNADEDFWEHIYAIGRFTRDFNGYASLCVGSSVYWVDPEEEAARNTILEYHDMSLEFWDSLSLDAMTELAREAGMSWPFSSGIYRIAMIASDSGVIESNDSIVMLMNEDGSLVEAHPSELRPADSQPGVASRPHREASAAHVDMRQTSAPAPAQ